MSAGVSFALALAAMQSAPEAAAATAPPTFDGPDVVAAAADFATDTFSDPWDYANREDIQLDAKGPVLDGVKNQGLSAGRLVFDGNSSSAGGTLALVWSGFEGAFSVGREGPVQPVHAGRYTHAAVRMYAGGAAPGGLLWSRCPSMTSPCQSNHGWSIQPGWHTYVIPLKDATAAKSYPWAKAIYALRLQIGPVGTHFEVDWIRLFKPSGDKTVAWTNPNPGSSARLFWDADADPGNNTAANPNWGPVPAVNAGAGAIDTSTTAPSASTVVPVGAFPPGTYRYYSASGATRSDYSAPLTIEAPPLPVIDDPDVTGGQDYISAASGNPWDFGGSDDVAALGNAGSVSWSGGQLHAKNTSNDPFFLLRLKGVIDADRYHRLTVKTTYDGAFGLEDAPGGGMHGRLMWRRDGDLHVSREIVHYTDVDTYTIDLATSPPTDVNDNNEPRATGWTGGSVTELRWDPNEDPGARRWRIDDIKLAADDESKGAFDIRWHDNNPKAGSAKVSLYYDTDRKGFDGALIASGLPQDPAGSSYRWRTDGIPEGRYWVYIVTENGASTSRRYASGPVLVRLTGPPAPRIAGADRLETAVKLSQAAFPDGAPVAVVARAGDFPDALAAAPLAVAAGGPLLLNPTEDLHDTVKAELDRLGASRVYLMGGTSAQSKKVAASLAAMAGMKVTRLAGPNRYATAVAAATETTRLWRDAGDDAAGQHVLIAVGTNFADALAAGPLASYGHRPLLLASPQDVPDESLDLMEDLATTRATVIGGTAALPDAAVKRLKDRGIAIDRIAGPTRYETARAAAEAAVAAGGDGHAVLIAAGHNFPDALAAGPAAAPRMGVLLLVGKDTLPDATADYLAGRAGDFTWLRVVGGTAAVSDEVGRAVMAASQYRE